MSISNELSTIAMRLGGLKGLLEFAIMENEEDAGFKVNEFIGTAQDALDRLIAKIEELEAEVDKLENN